MDVQAQIHVFEVANCRCMLTVAESFHQNANVLQHPCELKCSAIFLILSGSKSYFV